MRTARWNLAQEFYRRALAEPHRPALWVDGSIHSYRQLAVAAAAVAADLGESGVGPGSRVGILAGRSVASYLGVLGTVWAGAAYVPLSLADPAARMVRIVEGSELDALVADAEGVERLPDLSDVETGPILRADERAVDTKGKEDPLPRPVPVHASDLAYLLFTSGSTGEPKGVSISTEAAHHFLSCVRRRYRLRMEDRVAQLSRLTFDASVFELFAAWDAGATVYVAPELERVAPDEFVRRHGLTVWLSVPSTALLLAEHGRLHPGSLPSLRLSLFGGEALPGDLAARWQEAAPRSWVENVYGPTEATVFCLVQRCSNPPPLTRERDTVAIGRPLRGTRARVVGCEPGGDIGELALAGPQLAAGYWRDEELTGRRFVTLTEDRGEGTWFLTGDRVRRDGEGRFHFLGRLDHQVKMHGARVELDEIESLLRVATGCREAAAVAWPVRSGTAQGIVAFISGSELSGEQMRRELAKNLPAYFVPQRIITLGHLPRTSSGKVDRGQLFRNLG